MESITISQIEKHTNKEIKLHGWVYNLRSSGSIAFLQFRDGTGIIQAVATKNDLTPEKFEQIKNLTLESSVILTGKPKKDDRAPTGYELAISQIKIVQLAPDDYPIGKKEHGPDFLLSNRHLWLRSTRQWAIMKIRDLITKSINNYYQQHDFTKMDTPEITPSACEGTTTLFEIDYFGDPAYLSQSGQLYLEAGIFSFGKVYDFQPVFRAEKSKTRRHLIEFWMNNAEMAYCDLSQNIQIQEEIIMQIIKTVLEQGKPYLKIINRDPLPLEKITTPFPVITHTEAIKKLHELGSTIKENDDLGAEDETILMTHYDQPVFITHYPAEVKAFYMKRDPQQPDKALCADLLAPEGYGEIVGGSERENDYTKLLESMQKNKLPIKDYQWYLDLRKYGSIPHSGYGIGLERLVAWICGLKHVRETIPFPRLLNRCYP